MVLNFQLLMKSASGLCGYMTLGLYNRYYVIKVNNKP